MGEWETGRERYVYLRKSGGKGGEKYSGLVEEPHESFTVLFPVAIIERPISA